MGEIREPGPTSFVKADATIRFIRETEHLPANRSPEVRKRLLASIHGVEAESLISPTAGPEDASENLDAYLYRG